jgi:hypothetical protein
MVKEVKYPRKRAKHSKAGRKTAKRVRRSHLVRNGMWSASAVRGPAQPTGKLEVPRHGPRPCRSRHWPKRQDADRRPACLIVFRRAPV